MRQITTCNVTEEMGKMFEIDAGNKRWEVNAVKHIMCKYKDLIFTELDKNVNQWSIKCPYIYARDIVSFRPKVANYRQMKSKQETVQEQIEKRYKKRAGHLGQGKRAWVMNYRRVISKDKDIK